MAIKIVEDKSKLRKDALYKATCSRCGVVVEYTGYDVSFHRNFPKGFIYCPKCRKPIAHLDENCVKELSSDEKSKEKATNAAQQTKAWLIAILSLFLVLLGILVICLSCGIFNK